MIAVYARQKLPKSIFLAGPTPRSTDVESWRSRALELLKDFQGTVYVPEDSSGSPKYTYDDQVEWEWEALNAATVVLFWIPRNLETMPGFTTNFEYGMMIGRKTLAVGWPANSEKNSYAKALADRYNLPVYNTLEDVCSAAVKLTIEPFGS